MAELEKKAIPEAQFEKVLFDVITKRLANSDYNDIDTDRLIAVKGDRIAGILEIHLDDSYLVLEQEINETKPVVEISGHGRLGSSMVFNQENSASLAKTIIEFYRRESGGSDINFTGIDQFESSSALALERALAGALDHEEIKINSGWLREIDRNGSSILYKKSVAAETDARQSIEVIVSRAAGAEICGYVPLEFMITINCDAFDYQTTIRDEIAKDKFDAIDADCSS